MLAKPITDHHRDDRVVERGRGDRDWAWGSMNRIVMMTTQVTAIQPIGGAPPAEMPRAAAEVRARARRRNVGIT